MPNGGGDRIFAHIKSFAVAARRPNDGDAVTYTLTTGPGGKTQASALAFVRDRAVDARAQATQESGTTATLVALSWLALLGALALHHKKPAWLFGLYWGLSGLTYVVYLADKSAARRSAYRTSESTLLILGLVGGWPGALMAQRLLHHKSRKQSFQASFWATVIVNCSALLWLLSPWGTDVLAMLPD